jgi:hypothetical protein
MFGIRGLELYNMSGAAPVTAGSPAAPPTQTEAPPTLSGNNQTVSESKDTPPETFDGITAIALLAIVSLTAGAAVFAKIKRSKI